MFTPPPAQVDRNKQLVQGLSQYLPERRTELTPAVAKVRARTWAWMCVRRGRGAVHRWRKRRLLVEAAAAPGGAGAAQQGAAHARAHTVCSAPRYTGHPVHTTAAAPSTHRGARHFE